MGDTSNIRRTRVACCPLFMKGMVIRMSITGIVLIIAGVIVLALGYLVPVRKKDIDTESLLISEDEIRKMVDRELDNVKTHISDIVDETVTYSMEKTERSMERVTNEKIMAVNEYSDTVLEEINKNHKEVIFLYDMLNDKHENLKSAVTEATQTTDDVRQTLKDAMVMAQQADKAIEHVEMLAKETGDAIIKAMDEMDDMIKEAAYEKENAVYQAQGGYQTQSVYRDAVEGEDFVQEDDLVQEDSYVEDEGYAGEEDFAGTEDYEEDFAEEDDTEEEFIENERFSAKKDPAYEEPVYEEPAYAGEIFEAGRTAEKMQFDDEDDYFVPITPPRVNIIHDPDGDYVADPPQEEPSAEKAENRNFARRPSAPRKTSSRPAPSQTKQPSRPSPAKTAKRSMAPEFSAGRMADARSVNIQFANGKDRGRNSNERILELHKAGKSNMAIAKELGLGIGEVKLVIDLFEGL